MDSAIKTLKNKILELEHQLKEEQSLRLSEKEFQTILEDIQVGFYRTNEKGQTIMANPVAVKMLGYDSIEEAEGLLMVDLYKDPKDTSFLKCCFRMAEYQPMKLK